MEERRNTRDAMAAAAKQKHEFDAAARAQYVRDMVKQVEEYQKEHKNVDEIRQLMPIFYRDYKNLFEMITSTNGYSKESLTTMLAMLDRMGTGDLSQHQASVIVGQRLAQKYIKTDSIPPSNP